MTEPTTIEAAARGLREKQFTSTQLVRSALGRIARHNPRWGAVISVNEEAALAAAAVADDELARGIDRGGLHGIPVGVKDVLATRDLPTTCQSVAMLPGYQEYDSTAAAHLRDAGAVIIAKATCSEFAAGAPDSTRPFPLPRNPWGEQRWAGGSSGGSATGVQAGFFLGAVGTDTGGSIRVPSSFSGVTGLKPTRDLVPLHGCVPLSQSHDHIGPMGRTAYDCALLLTALTGGRSDSGKAGSVDYTAALTGDLRGIVLGLDKDVTARVELDDGLPGLFEDAIAQLESAGATIADVSLPLVDEIHAAARIVIAYEAYRTHRDNLRRRWLDYGLQTRVSLLSGAVIADADAERARRVLDAAAARYADILATVDGVVTVTLPTVAPPLDDVRAFLRMKSGAVLTSRWNAVGMPAISVPIGFLPAPGAPSGMPVAMQIAGRPFTDGQILRIADAYQRRTSWHAVPSPAELGG